MMQWIRAVITCLLAAAGSTFAKESAELFKEAASLYEKFHVSLHENSTWASDHGDTARSKFTIGAGLPLDFKAGDIKVLYQKNDIPMAQWIYTAGENSKYLYLIGGAMIHGAFVAKVDAFTMDVVEKFPLKPALYIGGMLIHKNGHVYCMHSNVLYAFWNGDLSNVTEYRLPTELNGNLVQTNGMLVTQDGYIVVKQWSLIFEDILFFVSAKKDLVKLLVALIVVSSGTIFYRTSSVDKYTLSTLLRVVVGGGFIGAALFISIVMLIYYKILGSFNVWTFLTSNTLFYGGGGGELKIIDPISMEVIAKAQLTERCSFARMAMTSLDMEIDSVTTRKEDSIVLLGDENVYQFRWVPSEKKLYMIKDWTTQYRKKGEGTFPGTGPAIYNNVAYFTDNTFPVFLSGFNYQMFATPLEYLPPQNEEELHQPPVRITASRHYTLAEDVPDVMKTHEKSGRLAEPSIMDKIAYSPRAVPRVAGVHLTREHDSPAPYGFMFWSVVVNPLQECIIVWDSIGRSVQCRAAGDIHKLEWEIKDITQGDCISVAVHLPKVDPETGTVLSAGGSHVYMTDYDLVPTPKDPNSWLQAVGNSLPEVARASKYFIAADAATGEVLANISIAPLEGIQPSVIVPGAHNDVYIGTKEGLLRIYV